MKVRKPKMANKTSSKKTAAKTSKNKEVEDIIAKINKEHGHNAITLGVNAMTRGYVQEYVSTGILQLDIDLGGGIPIGRYVEISGMESSTKTTLTMHILANAQKQGLLCAFLDIEGTSDEPYLRKIGVDVDNLLYSRPSSMEEAVNIVKDLQMDGRVKFCVYDSVAASLATLTEINEKDIGESMQMGRPQQLLQSMLRRHTMINNRFVREGEMPFTLIGINQLREKMGNVYGDPSYTPGGKAKDFSSTINIRLRQGDYIKEGRDNVVGQVVKYKISKNKISKRMQSGEVDFYYDCPNQCGVEGLHYDVKKDLVIVALGFGVVQKAGGWFSYGDLVKVQGMEKFAAELMKREDLLESIRKEVTTIAKAKKR